MGNRGLFRVIARRIFITGVPPEAHKHRHYEPEPQPGSDVLELPEELPHSSHGSPPPGRSCPLTSQYSLAATLTRRSVNARGRRWRRVGDGLTNCDEGRWG